MTPRTKRSATGPKYRKKAIGTQENKQTKGAIIKEEVIEEEEEHSKDATEDDEEEEQMDVSVNAEEEIASSSTPSKVVQTLEQVQQVVEMQPIPIALNPVVSDAQEQATVVTVTSPEPTVSISQASTSEGTSAEQQTPGVSVVQQASGVTVVQQASNEDIIAAELLRQIEASLQAGVAVVTVTESSQPEGEGQAQWWDVMYQMKY